jgi:glycosyltransferase involved in cell wall biosynthesis
MWKVAMRAYATCTGATKIIVISPAIGDLLRRLPVRASRCVQGAVVGVTIPDNVEMARRNADAVRAELEIASGDRVVMTIGGLDPRKSHELFLRGAAEVLSHRDDVRFFVVGAGPLRPDLIAEIDRLGITSNVRLLGERTDLDRLLSAADLYVRPGIVEGFIGTTLLDAQALEIPVVAFDTRDVRVAIAHGRTGWLVPPGDTSALAGAVIALLDNPALSRTIGKAGRAQVETHFSVPAVAGGLESLYRAQLDHLAPSS